MSAIGTALRVANRLRKEHPELVELVAGLVDKLLDGAPNHEVARDVVMAAEKRAMLAAFKQTYRRRK